MSVLKIASVDLSKGDTIFLNRSNEHGGNIFRALHVNAIVTVYCSAGGLTITIYSDGDEDFYSNVISFKYVKDKS